MDDFKQQLIDSVYDEKVLSSEIRDGNIVMVLGGHTRLLIQDVPPWLGGDYEHTVITQVVPIRSIYATSKSYMIPRGFA